MAFSADGTILAVASGTKVLLWRAGDWKLLRTLEGHTGLIRQVAFSPAGNLLASGAEDKTVRVWRTSDWQLLHTLSAGKGPPSQLAFSPDESLLTVLVGGETSTVRVWPLSPYATVTPIPPGVPVLLPPPTSTPTPSTEVAPRPADDQVMPRPVPAGPIMEPPSPALNTGIGEVAGPAAGYPPPDNTVGLKAQPILSVPAVITANLLPLTSADAASISQVGMLAEYTIDQRVDGREPIVVPIWDVAFSPDSRTLASAGVTMDESSGFTQLWHIPDGRVDRFITEPNRYSSVAFSPDGGLLAVGTLNTVQLWRPDGTVIGATETPAWSLAFAPDRNVLAVSKVPLSEVQLWNLANCSQPEQRCGFRPLDTLSGDFRQGAELAFAPDSATLALATWAGQVQLWQVSRCVDSPPPCAVPFHTLTGHAEAVNGVAFAPDSATIASGSFDSTVKLWRVADGQLLHTLKGSAEAVLSVAFNRDNTLLASGAADGTIHLWRLPDGQLLYTLTGHTKAVRSLAISPDGTLLASGSNDGTVRLWGILKGTASPEQRPR